MKMKRLLLVLVALLSIGILVGCGKGRPAAAPPGMHPEASKVAVEFYHAYILNQDFGKVWDISTDEVRTRGSIRPLKTKEEYLKFHEFDKPLPDRAFELQEHKRVGDYLYLISDAQSRWLVWVTKVDGQWKVRKWDFYDGGPIEW